MIRLAPHPDRQSYELRRQRVIERLLPQRAALVLFGGTEKRRSNDTHFRFRPDSNFHYLTGLAEPGAILVMRAERPAQVVLFVRERDKTAEIWAGRRPGPEGVTSAFGAHEAYTLTEFEQKVPDLIDGCELIYAPLGHYSRLEQQLHSAFAKLKRQNRDGKACPKGILDAGSLLDDERLFKDHAALTSLRRAVAISGAGHRAAMASTCAGLYEYEIEATIEYEFRRQGASGPGYGTIVAGGDNANILHYVDNESRLEDGQLVLVDAGAEWDYFSGDITRTWPVSGRFSPAQRDLYQVVLAANQRGIELATAGNTLHGIHDEVVNVLSQGLFDLGLCKGSVSEIIANQTYKKYYMHKTSHWLGLDVHDVGEYCQTGKPRPLAAHMVLTVEPALYVPADDEEAPVEMRGTGIRIEDDVLVLEQGNEVLTRDVPKQINEIEALVGTTAQRR